MLACFAALVRRFGLFFFYPSALFGLRSSVVCSISGESLNRSIVSKLFPLSDNPIIQAIQNDRYYCFLAPLTLPALLVAVYFHWLSMKLFKHA
ncbi:unnamed protein product [Arabidopsis lyrata]|uniref:Predicted protein n=1 Tax=Arabidopsis lyrata subsp. lyrata TaxID=81972 RepID=D7M523_ARALL|nr:predicted protein [Arabidopsis lyrata subsp. lyrata]EFH49836.1 predicted protein [Arabidopsis lyrata subsp. lyrata]EFH49837.1 predicted protein [Arabidopsis lyrata subsp. lyrata]CAH8270894.1 unnamed protein product [Arabidopsis lyrata]CAH8270901.1 unnamed protein product [Arabidopsis lyrata]